MSEPSPAAIAGDRLPLALVARKPRPRPGERRTQILQALAAMLEQPGSERITTAALAARLEISEAALYRHFVSKAQMLEALIEFIETSVFTLLNQVAERESAGLPQARRSLAVVLQFAERNPGMARLMAGDALAYEDERLNARMNQFFERLESQLRQSLRQSGAPGAAADAQVQASLLCAFALGRLQRFARSGFNRAPTEHLEAALALVLR
ncbi:nucleoid occlusion factor SlmA [Azohydromonas aeria]|uniref:nucleoid occlusion factor SlmA n=1 Tax=Azohydromonas aeria TaxID=2590212 RepID=UPI0012F97601|nr:nucleoid occlusion factor SlmA [Azohydromonas aeria]